MFSAKSIADALSNSDNYLGLIASNLDLNFSISVVVSLALIYISFLICFVYSAKIESKSPIKSSKFSQCFYTDCNYYKTGFYYKEVFDDKLIINFCFAKESANFLFILNLLAFISIYLL